MSIGVLKGLYSLHGGLCALVTLHRRRRLLMLRGALPRQGPLRWAPDQSLPTHRRTLGRVRTSTASLSFLPIQISARSSVNPQAPLAKQA